MAKEQNHHDDAIDKVLAALKDAVPPEGVEFRIAQRLQQHAQSQDATSRWRDRLTGPSVAGAWWRGAGCGVAAAMLAVCILLLIQHHSQMADPQVARNDGAPMLMVTPTNPAAVNRVKAELNKAEPNKPGTAPCLPDSSAMQMRSIAAVPRVERPQASSGVQLRHVLNEPLTSQERGLVMLARTADPQQLAILDPEARAKLKAENAAEFDQFFAPPAAPKTQDENE